MAIVDGVLALIQLDNAASGVPPAPLSWESPDAMAIVPALAAPGVANPRSGGDADASARLALVAAVTSEAPTGHFVINEFVTCDPLYDISSAKYGICAM